MASAFSSQFRQKYGIFPVRTNSVTDDEMALSEHIEEFSQRLIFCLVLLTCTTLLCFIDVKEIVRIFQAPAEGIKFLQFSPVNIFSRQ